MKPLIVQVWPMGVSGAVSRIPITVRVVPAPSNGEEVGGEQQPPQQQQQQQGEAEEAGPQQQQQQHNSQSHGEEEEAQRGTVLLGLLHRSSPTTDY